MSSILKTDKILDSQGNVVADANSIGWALGENFSWTDHSHLNQIIQTKIEVIDVDVKITTKKDQSAGTPVAGIPDELFRTSTGLITLSNVDNYVLIHITFVPVINALNVSGSTSGASGRFFVTEGAQVQEIYRLEQDTISNTVYTDAGSNSSSQHSPGIPIGFVDVPANKETTHRYPPLTISLLDKGSLSLTPKYHLHGICGTTSAGDSNEIGIAENSQIIVTAMEIDRSSSTIGTVIDGVFNFTDIITQDLLTGYDLNAKMTTYGWDGLTRVNVKVVVAEDISPIEGSDPEPVNTFFKPGISKEVQGVVFETDKLTNVEFENSLISIKAIGQSFPWGLGSGKFNEYAHELKNNDLYPTHVPYPDPHSTYFGILAENGLLGLIALGGIIFFVTIMSRNILKENSHDSHFITCLPPIFITIAIEAVCTDVMNFRHYWILLILLASSFESIKLFSWKRQNL